MKFESPKEQLSQKKKVEMLSDIQEARKTMRDFWHKEIDADSLKNELERKETQYTDELLKRGCEMKTLMGIQEKKKEGEKPPEKFHPTQFISASQNETKRKMIAKAGAEQGIPLQESLFPPIQEEEEWEHQIIKQLIQEEKKAKRQPSLYKPTIRGYDPAFFAIDIAESKALKMRELYPSQVIIASDIVVLRGNKILEKPRSKEEALKILKNISGKQIKVSLGVTLLTPTNFGKTVIMKEGAYLTIKLRNFSEIEAQNYINQSQENYSKVAGVLDYAAPETQKMIENIPVRVEPLEFGRKFGAEERQASLSPALLPQLKDYFMGVPDELIQEMLRRAKAILK